MLIQIVFATFSRFNYFLADIGRETTIFAVLQTENLPDDMNYISTKEYAAACGYDLANHHHALADAEACAAIALKIL